MPFVGCRNESGRNETNYMFGRIRKQVRLVSDAQLRNLEIYNTKSKLQTKNGSDLRTGMPVLYSQGKRTDSVNSNSKYGMFRNVFDILRLY